MNGVRAWLRCVAFVLLAGAQIVTSSVPAQAQAGANPIRGRLYGRLPSKTGPVTDPFDQNGNSDSLQARGLRASLNAAGVVVAGQDGNDWTWGLQVTGFGRGANPAAVGRPAMNSANGRFTSRYDAFSQWVRSTGIGIEQGFTVDRRPSGTGQLALSMRLDTKLAGKLSLDARTLSFAGTGGGSLYYSNLRAFDAAGRELRARLIYAPGQVIIRVDDSRARYPLMIDPLIYLETKVLALDGAGGDRFGSAVAISGDTAVVGAYGKDVSSGAAYIFQRTGTTWTQQAELTASDGAPNSNFGKSVAISGDTVVIGAPGVDFDQGKGYVFVKPAGGWTDMTETAQLTASNGTGNDDLGVSVAISANTIVAGADNAGIVGAAYVFVQSASGWSSSTETAELTPSDGVGVNDFGGSVAISGSTVVVGARFAASHGEAYVFSMPGSGWTNATETARLTGSDAIGTAYFGASVAISADTVLVGANETNGAQGKAYVFVKPVSGWTNATETAGLTASDGAGGSQFGFSLSISGDTAIIGAFGHDFDHGKAYVFVKPSGGWVSASETSGLTASDSVSNDFFGSSVALDGNTAIVGASGKNSFQGAAYLEYPYSPVDLSVQTLASPLTPLAYQPTTLTASVTNQDLFSPVPAVAVHVSLPAGFILGGSTATFGDYDPASGAWGMGGLAPGATAMLTLQVVPATALAGKQPVFAASLLGMDPNAANNNASVKLTVSPLELSPVSLAFGNQLMQTAGPPQTVTARNLGAAALTLGTLFPSSGFQLVSNTCNGALLMHNATCSFGVSFKPLVAKGYGGTITIPHNGAGGSTSLSLGGLGVGGTQLLANTSFETATLKVPDGWLKGGSWTGADGQDCTSFHTGSCSLKFTGSSLLKSLSRTFFHSGPSGEDLLLSLWSKAAGVPALPAAYRVRVQLLHGPTVVTSATINFAAGTHPFTQSMLGLTATGAYNRVRVIIEYEAASGKVWFDDASLTWAP